MEAPPKLCPRCGEEYLATVETCGDCGVALVTSEEAAARQNEAPAAADLPPPEEMAPLRTADPAWIHALSNGLDAAGIPHRVELVQPPGGPGQRQTAASMRATIFVLHDDLVVAREVDVEVTQEVIPDLEGAPVEGAAPGAELEHCPACGASLDAHAAECPDCGLVFAPES